MLVKMNTTDPIFGRIIGEQWISVHEPSECANEYCCIHNPSDHHMNNWPQLWRDDRKMMERICLHGYGHPDPDDISPNKTHGCDGCCHV